MGMQEIIIQTPQGTVKAVLVGAKTVEDRILGGPIRERWALSLSVSGLKIASQDRIVIPGKVDDKFCQDWAKLQTAEGYAENAAFCQQLIERLKDGSKDRFI